MHSILILCTGNSARSILAEALLNHRGAGRIVAFSAGSHPKGAVHPLALATLREQGLPTEGLRSKSWDEFATPGSPAVDLIITVCDNAAGEACPIWPGTPVTAHWGIADPAAANGSEAQRYAAFQQAFVEMDERVNALLALPSALRGEIPSAAELRAIGRDASGSTAK
jgi:arsenate reductase (thioredoxin)